MSKSFNLTAELNLRGPANIKTIVGDIKRELGTVSTDIKLQIDKKSTNTIDSITKKLSTMNKVLSTSVSNTNNLNVSLSQLASSLGTIGTSGTKVSGSIKSVSDSAAVSSKNIQAAASNMEEFGKQSFLAVKRFAAFTFATSGIVAFTAAVTKGLKAYVEFDQQIIRLRQVTGTGAIGVKILSDEITRLAQAFGVSSSSLAEVAVTLAQAGLSARETKVALEALAKSELAPSFDNIKDTTEGAIAALRQFNLETKDLEAVLGSINAVAAAFAVEASDIIAAVQRTGGVFASASKGVTQGTEALNEFIAIFTSIRATTRESAETIATGLRTIFTRIQRAKTIDLLRQLGVELQDVEGKFVGPFEAVRRLSEALNSLDPRDIRFSSIVEELGGFRQIGKVIPLLQQFETAQKALGVAQRGQSSLTDAQVIAQQSLANQLARVREQFLALVREVGQSNAFQGLFKIVTGLASGLISLASAFKPIIPILAVIGAVKGVKALSEFGGGFFGSLSKAGSKQVGENLGSTIAGTKEKERAEATSKAADAIRDNTTALQNLTKSIEDLNTSIKSRLSGDSFSDGGKVLRFNQGGVVPGSGRGDKVPALLEPGEVVMNNRAAQKYGRGNLVRMNRYARGGATQLAKTKIINNSGQTIGLNRDKYNINVDTKDVVLSSIDRYAGEGEAKLDNVSYKIKFTKQPKGSKGIGYKQFEDIIESMGFESQIGNGKTKNFPVDFIKNGMLYDAKNTARPVSDKEMAKKSMMYTLHKSKFGFDYTNPNETYEISTSDLPLYDSPTKLTDKQDNIKLPDITQLLVKYDASTLNPTQAVDTIQKAMSNLPKNSKTYNTLEKDLLSFTTSRTVGLAAAKRIFSSKERLATRNMDYRKFAGGKIQKFMAGSPDGVSEIDPFEQYGRIGALAKEKADKDKTLTVESALRKTLSEQLEGLGKEAGVRGLVSIPESFKRRLRRNLIEDGTLEIVPVTNILNNALKASRTNDAARKAKQEKTRKVAIAGLFPIDYNKDFPDWELDNGKEIYAYVRGFSSSYLDDVKALQQANSATRQKFAEDIQDRTALGLLGNKNVQGPVQPLAIDFDETLVRNTKMLDAEGEEDLPAYAIRDKVIASLADAKPTSLATRLANIEKENPGMVRQFTRILTARPQSTADIIASTLNRFDLPYLEQDITGVGEGLGTNIAKAKNAKLAAFEKLIDDNEKTIREVRRSGKSAFQYGEPTDLSQTAEEKFGISNIEGGMLESALAQLLGYPIDIDKLERNRAIDFPQGLGRGAQIFGLPPNIETEVKRTLDGDSFIKAREEFSRYFTENPDKFNSGGLVQSFKEGSTGGVKDRSTKNLVRGARGDNIVWKGMKVPLSYQDIMALSTEDMIAYGRSQEFDDYVFSGGAGIATKKLIKLPDGLTQEEIEAFGSDIIKKADGYYSEIEEIYKFRKAKNLTSPASSMREARTLAAMEAEKGNRFYTQAEEAIASFKKSGILSPFDPSIDSHIQSSFPGYISDLESQLKTEADPDEKNSIQRKLKKARAGWPDYQALLKGTPVPNQGRVTGLSETLNTLLESYGSPVSSKEIDSIISALGSKLMKKNIGGIIQSFKRGGKPSRYVDWESGVGLSPFNESSAPKLDYYSILERSGLNLKSWMIDSLADRARTNRWTEEQIIAEASRSQASSQQNLSSTIDRESLLSSLGARTEVSEKQRLLAQSLMGSVDAQYDPKYDKARSQFAIGGPAEDKKQKDFGKIGLRSSGSEITATYFKNNNREGFVSAKKAENSLYTIGLSKATKGYGPRLYDIVMEAATSAGGMLTSDRSAVSDSARAVWAYYFKNRGDVKKTPLDPSQWTKNQSFIDPKLYGKKETWPPFTDEAWILQSGYSKSPDLINGSDVIDMNDPKYASYLRQQQLSFINRRGGGSNFGGDVPARVSNGEAYVPPKTAQRIGYGTLNRMNQADRNGMGRFRDGGISVFKGPGSGTSDSIKTNLPSGSYILRAKATEALGLGFNKGGSVGVRKFSKGGRSEDDIDLGNKGREIKEKQLILKSKKAERATLVEKSNDASLSSDEKDAIDKKIKIISAKMTGLNSEISQAEEEFKALAEDIAIFSTDVKNTGKNFNAAMKELRDRVADSLTKQAAAKGETVTDEDIDKATRQVAKTGKAKTAVGKIDFTTFDAGRKLVEKVQNAQESFSSSKNIKNNRQKEFKERFGDTTSFSDIEQSSASNFVSRAKSEIEEQTKKKEELQTKASGATGAKKAILQDQILKSENRIKELNDAIDGTTIAYLEASKAVADQKAKIDKASKATRDAENKLDEAYQGIINALRKKITNFDSLSIETQTAAVKQVAETGEIITKDGKKITGPGLEAARKEYAVAEQQAKVDMPEQETLAREKLTELQAVQEKLNPSSLSSTTPEEAKARVEKQKSADDAFFEFKARKEGTTTRGLKLGIAQDIGKAKFEATDLFEGRKAELGFELAGKQDNIRNIGQTKARAEAVLASSAPGSAESQTAALELANANQRLKAETEAIVQQMIELNPTLGDSEEKMQQLRDSAEQVTESLVSGDLQKAQEELANAIGEAPSEAEALKIALTRTAKKLGISVDLLEREFGEAGQSAKEVSRQSFIQSREGQRFGNLAKFAPDALQGFSQSKLGGRLASGADFISGKGGRASQAFAKVGGIAGVGAGATLAADQLKNALKTYAPELSTNVEVAGALGALGGAGTGAASGAILGAQVAGPVGALVAGVGGAIIGGIQGYFSAKNQQILTNALEKIASTTGELDLAMKKLAQSADDVNFRSAQAAFGAVLDAGKDIRDMSQSSGFTSSDAGGVAAYAAGGAIAGAIAGSIVPILGTALGAALGGIAGAAYGVFNRPSEAQRKEALTASIGQASRSQDIASQLASSQLGRLDTEALGKIYDQLKDGTATVNPVVEQYVKGMLEAAKATEGANLSASRVEEITATAQANAALDSYMKSRKEAGATEEQIGRELKTDREQAIKIGQYYLNENAKLLVQQQMLAKATRDIADELANLGDVFKRISGFIDRFGAEMDELDSSIQNRIGDMTGKSEIKKSDRRFQRVLSDVGSYSAEDVEEAANFAINIGGGGEAARAFGQTAIISRVFQNQLPQLVRESKNIEGITDEEGREQAASNVTGELRRTLEDALKGAGELTLGAQTAINTIVGQAQADLESGKGLDDQGNLTKFSSVLQEGANGVAKFVQKYYDILDQAIKYQEQYNQLMIQSGEVLRKSNSIRINAELELKKTLGGTLSLDELTSSFDTEIKSLTSGLVDGGTTNPQEIARRLQEKEEQKKVLQEAVSNKALEIAVPENAGNRDKLLAEQNDLIAQQRDLSRSINEGSTALDRLANDGTKAAAALSKIQEGRQRSEAAGNLLEKIFTGSAADVNNMVINNAALQASQQDPSLLNSRATRQQAFAGLQQLQGILSPQDFNIAKADLLEGSLRASGVNLDEQTVAGKSFNDILADLRADPNQNDPMIKAYNDAINAQVKAGEMIADRLSKAAEQLKLPTKEEVEAGKFDPNSAIGEFINKVTAEYPTIVERAYAAVIADLEAIKARAEEGRGEPPREREEQQGPPGGGVVSTDGQPQYFTGSQTGDVVLGTGLAAAGVTVAVRNRDRLTRQGRENRALAAAQRKDAVNAKTQEIMKRDGVGENTARLQAETEVAKTTKPTSKTQAKTAAKADPKPLTRSQPAQSRSGLPIRQTDATTVTSERLPTRPATPRDVAASRAATPKTPSRSPSGTQTPRVPTQAGRSNFSFKGKKGKAAIVIGSLAAAGGIYAGLSARQRAQEQQVAISDKEKALLAEAESLGIDTKDEKVQQDIRKLAGKALTAETEEKADSIARTGLTALQLESQGVERSKAQQTATKLSEASTDKEIDQILKSVIPQTEMIPLIEQSLEQQQKAQTLALSESMMNINNASINIDNAIINGELTMGAGSGEAPSQLQLASLQSNQPQPIVEVSQAEELDLFGGEDPLEVINAELEKINQELQTAVVDLGTGTGSTIASSYGAGKIMSSKGLPRIPNTNPNAAFGKSWGGAGGKLKVGGGMALGFVDAGLDAFGIKDDYIGERGSASRETYETGVKGTQASLIASSGPGGIAFNTAFDAVATGIEFARDPETTLKRWDSDTSASDNIANAGLVAGSLQNASDGLIRPVDTISKGTTQIIGLASDSINAANAEAQTSRMIENTKTNNKTKNDFDFGLDVMESNQVRSFANASALKNKIQSDYSQGKDISSYSSTLGLDSNSSTQDILNAANNRVNAARTDLTSMAKDRASQESWLWTSQDAIDSKVKDYEARASKLIEPTEQPRQYTSSTIATDQKTFSEINDSLYENIGVTIAKGFLDSLASSDTIQSLIDGKATETAGITPEDRRIDTLTISARQAIIDTEKDKQNQISTIPEMMDFSAVNIATPKAIINAETGQENGPSGPDASFAYNLTIDDKSIKILESFNAGLEKFTESFGSYVSRLENLEFTHKLEGEYNININFTGEAPIAALNETMKELAKDLVMPEINKLREEIRGAGMDLRSRGNRG
jgi:hypothetical protein